jgi:hypothetical protein
MMIPSTVSAATGALVDIAKPPTLDG